MKFTQKELIHGQCWHSATASAFIKETGEKTTPGLQVNTVRKKNCKAGSSDRDVQGTAGC